MTIGVLPTRILICWPGTRTVTGWTFALAFVLDFAFDFDFAWLGVSRPCAFAFALATRFCLSCSLFTNLPSLEEFALLHPKDIKRQEKQNEYYDTLV